MLVVEDEEVIRGLVDQVLRGEGYEVLLAADGDEAIELADGNRVDVLLTDLTMPGIGGHDLADRLRAGAPELKVMFMSGFAEGNDFSTTGCCSRGRGRGIALADEPRRRAPDRSTMPRPRARRPARADAPALKVMFMSGFAEGNDFSTSALPPATAFLEKPFTFTMLSERMRELIAPSSN